VQGNCIEDPSTGKTKRVSPEKEAHWTLKKGCASKRGSVRLLLEFGVTILKFDETFFDAPVSIALRPLFDFPFCLCRGDISKAMFSFRGDIFVPCTGKNGDL
jgi:hypothetical protein